MAYLKKIQKIKNLKKEVTIGIVGKYFETGSFTLMDSYISVIESVKHAAFSQNRKAKISWISSGEFEKNPATLEELKSYDGIIVPGGFGNRGVEGKIKAIEYCRKNFVFINRRRGVFRVDGREGAAGRGGPGMNEMILF